MHILHENIFDGNILYENMKLKMLLQKEKRHQENYSRTRMINLIWA